jgi:hypothetical protein
MGKVRATEVASGNPQPISAAPAIAGSDVECRNIEVAEELGAFSFASKT